MASAEAQTLGESLRGYRQAAGLTQEELAGRSGLSIRAIGDLERDRRHPRKDTIRLLAQALSLSSEECAALLVAAHRSRCAGAPAAVGSREASLAARHPAPLALQLMPLIGREREEAAVAHLLARGDVRLLTLTGPAGVGKTRLAMQVATTLKGDYADGAIFIELTAIREAERVLPAIAQAVDVRESRGSPLRDALIAALRDRELLLVLDNFEQVLPAAPNVLDLLQACPRLKVLVTSRAVLNVRGEQAFLVPPLEVPDPHHEPSLADLERYASVALFIQRARAKKLTFALTTREEGWLVAAICRALDGLPLGIELAAARITLLPLRALYDRLKNPSPFAVLSGGGMQDAPERHRSLAAAIAWSYDLLSDDEQRLFLRLSAFMGGVTLEAVEAVCGEPGELPVLAHLASLVDQSLVQQEGRPNGEARFRMLETIHAYAWEQLEASGEAESVRRRHAAYFLAFAERAEPGLRGGDQVHVTARLEADYDNLRAVMRWAREHQDTELGMRLGIALHWFWLLHGPLREGRAHLDAIFALPWGKEGKETQASVSLRAKALRVAGSLAWKQSDFDRAAPLLEEALGLARTADEGRVAAAALHDLANVAKERGDFARATTLYEESLALKRQLGDTWRAAMTLKNLAELELDQGHIVRARAFAKESLVLCRQLGDTAGIAQVLADLGMVARHEGDNAQAEALFEQALALHRDIKNVWGIGHALRNLAAVMRERNEWVKARGVLQESLLWYRTLASSLSFAECLESFAGLARAEGQPERAVRLYATAAALRETLGAPQMPIEREVVERDMSALRASLEEPVFAAAWEVGRTRPVEEVLAELERVPDGVLPH